MEYIKPDLPHVGEYHLNVDPFDVDFSGHLTLAMLGNHLLNCAGFHADARGFGITRLNEDDCTWVLSRIALEFSELPTEYQHFTVNTWVEAVVRLFTSRNFEIKDQVGNIIGHARTMWAMINRQTRKPIDLLSINDGHLTDWITEGKECPIEGPSRIKVTSKEPVDVISIKFCDIDINGHLNSMRYVEHILNLFSLDFFRSNRIKRFEIHYITECLFGDRIAFYMDEDGQGAYQIEMRKEGSGEVVCRSKIIVAKA